MDYISIPGNAGPETRPEKGAPKKSDIVIVDDNPDNLRILSSILGNAGHSARPVSNPKMALNAILAKPPDLVLLDIMMPDLDGFELCGKLKSNEGTKDIPVIFISALDELEEKLRAFSMGGVDYVSKPFQEAEIIARVETHLKLVDAKEALQKSEALKRRLKKAESLARMAGAVAHQFNNHLQAVIGNLEMTMNYLPDASKAASNIESAMNAAQKAADVSRLMLTAAGQAYGPQEPLDLSEYCRSKIHMFPVPGSIVVETDFPSPGPVVMASPSLLQQVIENLIINAVEAMTNRPGIVRAVVKTYSSLESPGPGVFPPGWEPKRLPHACLEIQDHGRGIAAPDLENIFDPFFSTHFPGRGLGLPVALGIAVAHGGGMTVESTQGAGSIFRFFIPICDASLQADPETARSDDSIAKNRAVLLVEEDEHVRNLVSGYLDQKGYRVVETSSGTEALAVIDRLKDGIQCVLMNVTMPGMTGWETLDLMRRGLPGIYVILTSGGEEVLAGTRREEMPQVFLRKPYKLPALLEVVENAFARQTPRAGGRGQMNYSRVTGG